MLTINQQGLKPTKHQRYRGRRTYPTSVDVSTDEIFTNAVKNQKSSSVSLKVKLGYYAFLFVKVGLWLVFAWALSHLHLGAPCFLLPVILWLYSVPLSRAMDWAKRRLMRGPVTEAQKGP